MDHQRKYWYGKEVSSKDYRDSYILGEAIDTFVLDDVHKLLAYKKEDSEVTKVAKSITLKAKTHERLTRICEMLGTSESETCRLIIFHLIHETLDEKKVTRIPKEIELELAVLKKALSNAQNALKAIEKYYFNK